MPLIAHFILSNNLDILVITETKFSVADGPDDARALCPEGFSSIQVSRNSVHRGGGVALLYRDAIVATDKRQCVPHTCPITYEYMSLALTVNSVAVRLVVVYRPPKLSVSCSELGLSCNYIFFLLAQNLCKLRNVGISHQGDAKTGVFILHIYAYFPIIYFKTILYVLMHILYIQMHIFRFFHEKSSILQ